MWSNATKWLSILFCTSSNFYLGEPCSLFVYGVKAPVNRTVRRVTSDRIQDVIFSVLLPGWFHCLVSVCKFPPTPGWSTFCSQSPFLCCTSGFYWQPSRESHANGLCDAPQIRTIFDFEVQITIGLVWPKKRAMMGYLLCTLCTACCNKDLMNGSGFAYDKYLTC